MAVFATRFDRSALIDADPGTPAGINIAVGAMVITAALFGAALVPVGDPQWRCAVVALSLTLFAVFTADSLAVTAIVVPTWMVMNGFLVNRLGELSWHGWPDLDRFLVLVAAGCTGLALGTAHRMLRDLRERWRLGAEVHEMCTVIHEETKQRA